MVGKKKCKSGKKKQTTKNLPIDAFISPEEEVAKALHRILKSPGS